MSARTLVEPEAGEPVLGWYVPPIQHGVEFAEVIDATHASTVLTIESSRSPSRFQFALNVPDGDWVQATADGGFDVVRTAGNGIGLAVGHIERPWAYDAMGRPRSTRFSLEGSTLVQTIDTEGATFPVVADPKITWGWVTGTIYFNKSETANVAAYGGISGYFSTLVPGWGWALGAYAGVITTVAARARAHNHCLKIKLPAPVPQEYSGDYCR